MTFGEKFISILMYQISSLMDLGAGTLITLSVIMLMICLLSKKGELTRKSITPILIFFLAGGILTLYCTLHDFIQVKDLWNEPYRQEQVRLIGANTFGIIPRICYWISIWMTAYLSFRQNRILAGLEAVLLTFLFTDYIMLVLAFSFMYFSDTPQKTIYIFTHMQESTEETLIYLYMLVCFIITIFVFLAFYYGMYKKKRILYTGTAFKIQFLIWYVLSIFICIVPFLMPESEYINNMEHELGLISPILGGLVPILTLTILSRHYATEKALIQEDYISAELNYIEQYKKNQNETSLFRFGIINNLETLSAMLTAKNFDKANAYLATLLGNVKDMSPKFSTGDEMLDCIVGMKSLKMESEGISFSVDGMIDGGLQMNPVDICSLFANALDNAIEACEKLTATHERRITLSIKKTENYYSVKLSNTMPLYEASLIPNKLFKDGELITTKKDKTLHGFGTQNIKATIAKYGGMEKIEVAGGIFTLSIMIPKAL